MKSKIQPKLFLFVFLYSLDHLDKQDTPSIPDGYTLSIAFACVLEIVKALNTLVVQGEPASQNVQGWIEPDEHFNQKSNDTGVGVTLLKAMAKDESTEKSMLLFEQISYENGQ